MHETHAWGECPPESQLTIFIVACSTTHIEEATPKIQNGPKHEKAPTFSAKGVVGTLHKSLLDNIAEKCCYRLAPSASKVSPSNQDGSNPLLRNIYAPTSINEARSSKLALDIAHSEIGQRRSGRFFAQ
jgi:hypothetical protein